MKVALHLHSKNSDGELTREEILRKAKNEDCKMVAICDHDYVTEAINDNDAPFMIQSCEITADDYSRLHILGYGVKNLKYINSVTAFVAKMNSKRCSRVIDGLREDGIDITAEDVCRTFNRKELNKAIIKQYLVLKNYAKSTTDAYIRYIGRDTKNYVKLRDLPASTVTRLINVSGGMPVLAHPGSILKDGEVPLSDNELDELVGKLTRCGLQGIEVKNFKSKDRDIAYRLAKKYDLIPMTGSDFHQKTDTFGFEMETSTVRQFVDCLEQNSKNYDLDRLKTFHTEYIEPLSKMTATTLDKNHFKSSHLKEEKVLGEF